MYPGDGISHLPELTQMEEMLISPVDALVQLWQICGGQTKDTGHTCNFPRENAVFHAKVPLLPEECDIIMRHTAVEVGTDEAVYQDLECVGMLSSNGWNILLCIIQHFNLIRSLLIIHNLTSCLSMV
jgi:hypothetical protein